MREIQNFERKIQRIIKTHARARPKMKEISMNFVTKLPRIGNYNAMMIMVNRFIKQKHIINCNDEINARVSRTGSRYGLIASYQVVFQDERRGPEKCANVYLSRERK